MNMNTNIFGIIILTGYEYEHIRNIIVDQIRMYEYFSHEYLDIIIEKYFNIPWNSARGHKIFIIRKFSPKLCYFTLSNLYSRGLD